MRVSHLHIKSFCVAVLLLALFVAAARETFSQEARLIDQFGRQPCGHMMAILDVAIQQWALKKDEQIAVVYYGSRFHKTVRHGKGENSERIVLEPVHRDDALNLAKGIVRYFIGAQSWPAYKSINVPLKDKVVLMNGGFKEELEIQLWLVPPGAPMPSVEPTIREQDVQFKAKRPIPVPDYLNCYSIY